MKEITAAFNPKYLLDARIDYIIYVINRYLDLHHIKGIIGPNDWWHNTVFSNQINLCLKDSKIIIHNERYYPGTIQVSELLKNICHSAKSFSSSICRVTEQFVFTFQIKDSAQTVEEEQVEDSTEWFQKMMR